jgi:hypothetical protein
MPDVFYTIQLPVNLFVKETNKAYCFQFEDGEWANMPKSEITSYNNDGKYITFDCPEWLVTANDLDFFILE